MPEWFGNWNTAYVRFRRLAKKGVWQQICKEFADEDVTTLLIDSTMVRVRQHGAGALKKGEEDSKHNQATGRSKGGLTTKIHVGTYNKGKIK